VENLYLTSGFVKLYLPGKFCGILFAARARAGEQRMGAGWIGMVEQCRLGAASPGRAGLGAERSGSAVQAWRVGLRLVMARCVTQWPGMTWQARTDVDGKDGSGVAGLER